MRPPVLLTLIVALLGANTVEARLFWQTYGSVIPADGCGSSWNWNQDYFIPRHCSSCRYGLFSPCKTSCTTSPACISPHSLHPEYCEIYSPCHYGRRDHVYHRHCGCGCGPVQSYHDPWRHGCRPGCGGSASCGCYPLVQGSSDMLPNVERSKFQVLGNLPVPGDELLASLDLGASAANDDDEALPGVLLPRVTPVEPPLPSLGRPPTENPSQ